MQESLRQAYLSELGLDSYFPRTVQAGAAASPDWQSILLAEQPVVVSPELDVSSQVANDSSPASALAQSLEPTSAPSTMEPVFEREQFLALEAAALEQGTETLAETSQAAVLQPFTLRYWIAENILLVEGVNDYFLEGSDRLIFNLCHALGREVRQQFPDPFSWPVRGMPAKLANQADQARSAARVSLKAAIEQANCTYVILLGAVPASVLLNAEDFTTVLGQSPVDEDINASLWCTHSVNDLLMDAQLKKQTWQHVQALIKRA